LALVSGPLWAREPAFFAALGLEGNANTREGAAFGGGLLFGCDFNRLMAAGVKAAFSTNLDTISTLEPLAFFRMYLPLGSGAPFAQAEAGMSVFLENGNAFPAFNGGLALGWRFLLGQYWYVEPSIRSGYPYVWGGGISAGLRFAAGKKQTAERSGGEQ
jgi:hypothetical protein